MQKQTHTALLAVAVQEHKFLAESQKHDGFSLSALEILTGTDEELHVVFSLTHSGQSMHFTYSLGFDPDEAGYFPYVEVCVGDERNPNSFSTKQVGGFEYVKDELDLLDSIEQLSRNCGEARFEAFRRLEQEILPVMRG